MMVLLHDKVQFTKKKERKEVIFYLYNEQCQSHVILLKVLTVVAVWEKFKTTKGIYKESNSVFLR